MKAASDVPIDLPAARVDLRAWLAILSDRDYQACSPGHIAAGIFHEEGVFGSINVENVGGHLLVHHYHATPDSRADRLVMHSRNTRVYVMHLAPATIEVIWTLELEPRDAESALFRCTVEVRIPTVLNAFATLGLLPYFLRRHVEGEAPLFARDMVRKVADGRL